MNTQKNTSQFWRTSKNSRSLNVTSKKNSAIFRQPLQGQTRICPNVSEHPCLNFCTPPPPPPVEEESTVIKETLKCLVSSATYQLTSISGYSANSLKFFGNWNHMLIWENRAWMSLAGSNRLTFSGKSYDSQKADVTAKITHFVRSLKLIGTTFDCKTKGKLLIMLFSEVVLFFKKEKAASINSLLISTSWSFLEANLVGGWLIQSLKGACAEQWNKLFIHKWLVH